MTLDIVKEPELVYALRVQGESMRDASVHDGDLVILRQQQSADAGEMVARLEYPIKTMNVNDAGNSPNGDWIYQVDTGPILAPDPRRQGDLPVERLDLAFIAWNAPDRAELIALEPTRVNHSDDCVGHYSRVQELAARNQVLALT